MAGDCVSAARVWFRAVLGLELWHLSDGAALSSGSDGALDDWEGGNARRGLEAGLRCSQLVKEMARDGSVRHNQILRGRAAGHDRVRMEIQIPDDEHRAIARESRRAFGGKRVMAELR